MAIEEHPCAGGLTPECFEAYPEWAKLAFCYKLLHVLIPANISRRLPKGLFPGRIGPGAILPPGWIPPPGVIIPPNYTVPPSWIPFTYFILPPGVTWEQIFPPGWTAEDPLPPGVTINAGAVFPVGWSAGDALPAGVSISPGAAFPPGWTPGDPLPPGVTINAGAIVPAGWSPTNPPPAWFAPGGAGLPIPPDGVLPPLYLPPGLQSPPHVPQPRSPVSIPVITEFTSDSYDDDGYWNAGGNLYDSTTFNWIGNRFGLYYNNWYTFKNITINKGKTIKTAKICFTASGSASGTPFDLKIHGNSSATPANPTTAAEADAITLTANNVAWSPEDFVVYNSVETPEIKSIIQEIINGASWASGNSLMMLIKPVVPAGDARGFITYEDAGAGQMPTLHIET